jgi:hypothetical protein
MCRADAYRPHKCRLYAAMHDLSSQSYCSCPPQVGHQYHFSLVSCPHQCPSPPGHTLQPRWIGPCSVKGQSKSNQCQICLAAAKWCITLSQLLTFTPGCLTRVTHPDFRGVLAHPICYSKMGTTSCSHCGKFTYNK